LDFIAFAGEVLWRGWAKTNQTGMQDPNRLSGLAPRSLRQWEDKKAHFEVIVGKSLSEDRPSRCFGFVQTYDEKPKRRLFELLKGQGIEEVTGENSRKLRKVLGEFDAYVVVNEALIPNYGERWRNEESIATGFVESAVNQIVSKRFSKKQQMQWTKKSAHLVLQMRTQVLDERLEETFRDWYLDFRTTPPEDEIKRAA
jgi:hypothetical protein